MKYPVETRRWELEVKKSLFISTAIPVKSSEEAKAEIQDMRDRHPKCSHVVWAFCTGVSENPKYAMSDDGEPKGTAGRPVLRVIQNSEITNILVTVVRYFGGTKLGRGGLVRAYAQSAGGVVANTRLKEIVAESMLRLEIEYGLYEKVIRFLKSRSVRVDDEDFSTGVVIHCGVAMPERQTLCSDLTEMTGGTIKISFHEPVDGSRY